MDSNISILAVNSHCVWKERLRHSNARMYVRIVTSNRVLSVSTFKTAIQHFQRSTYVNRSFLGTSSSIKNEYLYNRYNPRLHLMRLPLHLQTNIPIMQCDLSRPTKIYNLLRQFVVMDRICRAIQRRQIGCCMCC